jgi:hypothetical protein
MKQYLSILAFLISRTEVLNYRIKIKRSYDHTLRAAMTEVTPFWMREAL